MARYTLELYKMTKDPNFKLFNFDYDFYVEDIEIKSKFEQKFIDKYMFCEIGQETVARFRHFLKTELNEIMPYYKQLYETELRTKDIDFMLNKDYTETYTREHDDTSKVVGDNVSDYKDNSKTSDIANGVSNVELTQGSLTQVSGNTSSNKDSLNSESIEKRLEKYSMTGKGNIGVTSAGALLESWRKIIINIDQMILEDLSDMFMQIY